MPWVINATPEVDAASQWRTIVIICIVFSFVAAVIAGMRIWVRARARGMEADDWMASLSLVFAIMYSIICIIQTRYGLGLPLLSRPKENLIPFTRINYAGRPIYQVGISFFKIALLISYLRLFDRTNVQRVYRRVVLGTIALIFLSHLGCALALILACTPVEKSWNPNVPGKCLDPGPSFTGYAVVTIVSDIIVALIPIPVLLKLNVSRNKKLGLIGIFLLGLFTTICSIMRYLSIDQIQNGDGNSTLLVLWGVIEFNVGNMVSSLPFLAPFFVRKAREYRSRQSHGYGSYGHSHGRGKGSQAYKLSTLSRTDARSRADDTPEIPTSKGTLAYATATATGRDSDGQSNTWSEEEMLRRSDDDLVQRPGNAIMKSVSYSVEVNHHQQGTGSYP